MNKEIDSIIARRMDAMECIRNAQVDARIAEHDLTRALVEGGHVDMLRPNYTRLSFESANRRKVR